MSFKELYSFTLDEEREVEKKTTRKNKKTGEETTVTKKVKEKSPVQIKLKRPSRRDLEDAELEYSVEMSRCVKKGILTKAMLYKTYCIIIYFWSEDEAKDYSKLYREIFNLQNEYARIETIEEKTESHKKKLEEVKDKLADTRRQIVDAETAAQSLFDHTADLKAQNRLLLWYTLMLTYIQTEEQENPVPYFAGETFEEKMEDYYNKEDQLTDFYSAAVKKITTVLAFWFFNQASSPDEFNNLIEKVEKGEL